MLLNHGLIATVIVAENWFILDFGVFPTYWFSWIVPNVIENSNLRRGSGASRMRKRGANYKKQKKKNRMNALLFI